MPSINDAYPSRYLSVEDLQGRAVRVTIERVTPESIGQGQNAETKLVATLAGKKKVFVINKTNAKAIAMSHGPNYDLWSGKEITLSPREVEFQGETVWAIRVQTPMPGAIAAAPAPKPAVTEKQMANLTDKVDEDVPF